MESCNLYGLFSLSFYFVHLVKFNLNKILIKILFLKVAKKSDQRPCTIVHSFYQNNCQKRIHYFYNFSNAYTCTYDV